MDVFTLGSLLGRLLFAYLVVWLVCFLISKARYKSSVELAHSKKGLGALGLVFLLPLLVQLGSAV